jgi:hypothetical protein
MLLQVLTLARLASPLDSAVLRDIEVAKLHRAAGE